MTRFQRLLVLYRQFRFATASRLLLLKAIRRLLDPYNADCFSQSGEDRIIECLVGPDVGYYVEVGCHHPQRYSNTFRLYKRGWSGLTVDANPSLIRRFEDFRPRDKSICAVVSDREADMIFTAFGDSLVSSLDAAHVSKWTSSQATKSERCVRTTTLQVLLRAAGAPKRFGLLSIDVEGHDFEVLRSLDLAEYRPRLIVIEMHGFDFADASSSPICSHLARNGYKMIGYAVMNGYFTDVRTQAFE